MEGLDILEKKNAIKVLIQVFENPGINKSRLIDLEPEGRGSKLERIDELVEAGLICTEKTIEKNSIIKLYTTKKGSDIAKYLINAKLILNDLKPEPKTNLSTPSEEGCTTIKE